MNSFAFFLAWYMWAGVITGLHRYLFIKKNKSITVKTKHEYVTSILFAVLVWPLYWIMVISGTLEGKREAKRLIKLYGKERAMEIMQSWMKK